MTEWRVGDILRNEDHWWDAEIIEVNQNEIRVINRTLGDKYKPELKHKFIDIGWRNITALQRENEELKKELGRL